VFFKPFQDADVGFAERAAAFESDADFQARGGDWLGFGNGSGGLLRRRWRLLREGGTRKAKGEKRGE
jgi:hypothetical protein